MRCCSHHAPHLGAIARRVQPALKDAVRKGARVPPPARSILGAGGGKQQRERIRGLLHMLSAPSMQSRMLVACACRWGA